MSYPDKCQDYCMLQHLAVLGSSLIVRLLFLTEKANSVTINKSC